jgi:transcriptional regulator with XRE-family HTH domain
MSKRAENYTSGILSKLMSEISPEEQAKTDKRMLLALKIANAMKAKGWKKGDLAREMNQQPSVITKWFSGTHNFTSDTLFDLEFKLGVRLISVEEKIIMPSIVYHVMVQSIIKSETNDEGKFIIPSRCFFSQKIEPVKMS